MRVKLVFAVGFLLLCGSSVSAVDFFWEPPSLFTENRASFPQTASGGGIAVVAWQEAEPLLIGGRVRIHLAVYKNGAWHYKNSVGGIYSYGANEPSIFSLTVDSKGRIFIPVYVTSRRSEVIVSDNGGETFNRYSIESPSSEIVAPRIFPIEGRGKNAYLLFMTRRTFSGASIYYARSEDGYRWTDWIPFVSDQMLLLNYFPVAVSVGNTVYVVFQSFMSTGNAAPAFQLFIKTSNDGGFTWSPSRRLTNFQDPAIYTSGSPDLFNNERPHLSVQNGILCLVWERSYGAYATNIYGMELDSRGFARGLPFRISSGTADCQNPFAVNVEGETAVLWFDNRVTRDRSATLHSAYLAQKREGVWENRALSYDDNAVFARPLLMGNSLSVFWQSENRLYLLSSDVSIAKPLLAGENFTGGKPVSGNTAAIRWSTNEDSSGIAGFAYQWSRSPYAVPPEEVMLPATATGISQDADEDGEWYFSLRSKDNAGNWSLPETITFIRDTTPPGPVEILPLETDEQGYLASNTFSVFWKKPEVADLGDYVWNLELLDEHTDAYQSVAEDTFLSAVLAQYQPADSFERNAYSVSGQEEQTSYDNIDDGIWRFSLAPVDQVGNIGPPSDIYFRTNKYVPHTFITHIDYRQDDQGDLSMRIIGRGFEQDGTVTSITMGRDGDQPEQEIVWQSGEYTVVSDREISMPFIKNLQAGLYYVGITHPLRGSYVTRSSVFISPSQTIKYGDFSNIWEPSWTVRPQRRIVFNSSTLVPALILAIALALVYYSIHGLAVILKEGAIVRMEMAAIISGEVMPEKKKRQITKIKLRGMSLRIKLALFTTALVVAVVGMVSMPVYIMMNSTERETLFQGLWDRSTVLLEGIASNVRTFLPSNNLLELSYLPEQSAAIPEAVYITITSYDGSGINSGEFGDFVWVTNDPQILDKIDTSTFQPGISRITDALTPRMGGISGELNEQARREVSGLAESISSLTQEALSLSLQIDEESQNRIIDIQTSTRSLEARLTEQLKEIGREIGSEPEYSTENIAAGNQRFILFKPVLFRQGGSNIYFRGLIRLEISTKSIEQQIAKQQVTLFRVIVIVAAIAILIGFVGAFILATLIIQPIRRLVSHIETIRDTEDKIKLEGKDIRLTTNDELTVLGDTINDMTRGLVKAARAAADLSIGKEIQKKFIPLDLDSNNDKLTSGYKSLKNVEFFGYYEGAKGVSGDYFDYQSLDNRYFAIIKCDVAGKGIPAALIMIQVATMFINHFRSWKADKEGMHIEKVVYQINDFIETLGFQGRFAAFTLVLFDSETGVARFCSAGDNIIHWFDATQRRIRQVSLPETPATGVLPNYLVEMNGGYQTQTMTFNKGDILLLYTDGVEEAKRLFRNTNFEVIKCQEGGAPRDTPHDTHVVGQDGEEIGMARQTAIINAVMNRGSFRLYKYHNPEGEDTLDFDYTACTGTTEELIMAMVSAEKIFRMYKNPNVGNEARVLVDRKVDAFLKKHFLQYGKYGARTAPADSPGYLYYLGVQEDEQYDDLTILGVKRK